MNIYIYIYEYIYMNVYEYVMNKKRTSSVNWKNGHALKRLLRCADSVAEKISVSWAQWIPDNLIIWWFSWNLAWFISKNGNQWEGMHIYPPWSSCAFRCISTPKHDKVVQRVTNFKTHKSPPKRHDCNDFLKFVCQPKSRKSIQLPWFSSLGV